MLFSRLYKIMVDKVIFVGFRGSIVFSEYVIENACQWKFSILESMAQPAQRFGEGHKFLGDQNVWFQANNTILFGKTAFKAQNDYIF